MASVASLTEHQAVRMRARLMHWLLDERPAAGFEPESDPALAARAAQLCSSRHRRRLAGSVERLARDSEIHSRMGLTSAVPIVREQVEEARDSLLRLAAVLREGEQVRPRGVAMVQRLLTDADSFVYTRSARGVVELQVQAAPRALAMRRDKTAAGGCAGQWAEGRAGVDASALSSASATPAGRPRLTQTAYR